MAQQAIESLGANGSRQSASRVVPTLGMRGGLGKTLLIADMTVGYKLIRETFTSQVLLKPDEKVIETKYVDGPFRYLDNKWQFVPSANPEHSEVKFYIDYEFKSRTLGFLMGSMFDIAFRKFTEAFEKRADQIYGRDS